MILQKMIFRKEQGLKLRGHILNKNGRINSIRVRYLSASIICFIYNLFY